MKKEYQKKYILPLCVITAVWFVFGVLGILPLRLDFTADKRYTLTETSEKILKNVKKPVNITVYLEGEFPANYRALQNEIRYLLTRMQKENVALSFSFVNPNDENLSKENLAKLGVEPAVLPEYQDGKISETIIYPYAVVSSGSRKTAVPLLADLSDVSPEEQVSRSAERLEYALISGISDVQNPDKQRIGIIINHDELGPRECYEFMRLLSKRYEPVPLIPANKVSLTKADIPFLKTCKSIVVAKPRKAFNTEEKLILDQYTMQGGRSLWMIDAANVEMDSLTRSQKITAFPQETELGDLFFSYGVRIVPGIVKDVMRPAQIRIVAGEINGNPQFMSLPWPYFPLGIGDEKQMLTRNINPVKFEFATSIDTLYRKGVKKEVLFETSEKTLQKALPAFIELNEIASVDSIAMREKPSVPKILALAMEGVFPSAYAARQERGSYPGFKYKSVPTRMVIVADGDLARNKIYKGKPMPIGTDMLTDQKFGNDQFLMNAVDWLMDDAQTMAIRNRTLASRLLNQDKINEDRRMYQILSIAVPVLLFLLCGFVFWYIRKRKYAAVQD